MTRKFVISMSYTEIERVGAERFELPFQGGRALISLERGTYKGDDSVVEMTVACPALLDNSMDKEAMKYVSGKLGRRVYELQ